MAPPRNAASTRRNREIPAEDISLMQDFVDTLHEWHGSWVAGFYHRKTSVSGGFRRPQVNADDYRDGARVR